MKLTEDEVARIMRLVRIYGNECRREERAISREVWMFRKGRTDAARLDIYAALRGDTVDCDLAAPVTLVNKEGVN